MEGQNTRSQNDGSIVEIEISRLDVSQTQTRDGLRENAVQEYADVLQDGGELPPVVAYRDTDGTLYLASGFHRREAHIRAGRTAIRCVIQPGDRWAAIQAGIRDNRQHNGERLTNADKAYAVQLVLRIKPANSDNLVASLCGVSPRTVAKYRTELEATAQIAELGARVDKHGHVRSLPQRRALATPAEPASPIAGQPAESLPAAAETAAQVTQETPGLIGSSVGTPGAVPELEPSREPVEAIRPVESHPPELRTITDKLSATPSPGYPSEPVEQPRPPLKSTFEQLRDCQKRLGFLARGIDELKRSDPAQYNRVQRQLSAIGQELDAWRQAGDGDLLISRAT